MFNFCYNCAKTIIDIDGPEGMKLTFGTIAVEGKDSQGKVAKVNSTKLITFRVLSSFLMFFINNMKFRSCF